MNDYSSRLLSIGSFADRFLPTVLTALSCGAASSVENLDIFRILPRLPEEDHIAVYAEQLTGCHRLTKKAEGISLFPSSFSCASWAPVLPDARVLSDNPETALLISALRGK